MIRALRSVLAAAALLLAATIPLQSSGVSPAFVGARVASKAYANLTGYDTAVAFTVTGVVKFQAAASVGTGITSTSGTTTLSFGTTQNDVLFATLDGAVLVTGDVWTSGSGGNHNLLLSNDWYVTATNLSLIRDVDDITAGAMTLYVIWEPISPGATVVAN